MQSTDRAIIVASGPSAAGFRPPVGAFVIAVNGAIDWLDRADAWFTLDPSTLNMRRMRYQRRGVSYYAAVPAWKRLPDRVHRFARISAPGLSDDPTVIHSGNSAFGAVGLAYHMGARKVMLVGVDGTQDRRLEGGRPFRLDHLHALFETCTDKVELVSCGLLKSNGIPTMTREGAYSWLMR